MEDKRIDQIEKEMEAINKSLADITDILGKLNENVKKVSFGLYGDKDNDQIGIIEKQRSLENRILDIEKRLAANDLVNEKQNAAIDAERDLKVNWWNIIKWVGGFIAQGVIWYLIFKGILQPSDGLK
jgi:hypothetical protein